MLFKNERNELGPFQSSRQKFSSRIIYNNRVRERERTHVEHSHKWQREESDFLKELVTHILSGYTHHFGKNLINYFNTVPLRKRYLIFSEDSSLGRDTEEG